jgi:hypothetical protein
MTEEYARTELGSGRDRMEQACDYARRRAQTTGRPAVVWLRGQHVGVSVPGSVPAGAKVHSRYSALGFRDEEVMAR